MYIYICMSNMYVYVYVYVYMYICVYIDMYNYIHICASFFSKQLVTTAVFCLWHPPAGIVGVSALQKHPGPPARRASSWRQKASPNQTPRLDWRPLSSDQQRPKFEDVRDMCQTSKKSETCVKPRNVCETSITRARLICT